jgi:hypothetical protein
VSRDDRSTAASEAQPLKGWLLVLSRALIIWEPLEFAVAASGALNAVAVRGLPVVLVLAVRLAATVLSMAAARSLSSRDPRSPTLAMVALGLTGAIRLFAYLTPYFPSNRLPGQTPFYVAVTVVYYGGCLAYLAWSKQAKALREG